MIQLQDITKSFGPLPVLRGISLEVARGEVVSIVGPSGAGKTTLLQIMGTLDRPDTGTVVIDGTPVGRMKERELAAFRNRHIGFVFQFHQLSFQGQYFRLLSSQAVQKSCDSAGYLLLFGGKHV